MGQEGSRCNRMGSVRHRKGTETSNNQKESERDRDKERAGERERELEVTECADVGAVNNAPSIAFERQLKL
jgi:hypothetical protein